MLFVPVTSVGILAVWTVYQLNWIRERENLLAEWRALGGETVAGPVPWRIRMLGAQGVARFQYGILGGIPTRPPMILLKGEVRDQLMNLFPESRMEVAYRW